MFFLEPLLERLFNDFMSIFCENIRFWDPFVAQLGSKMSPWGDHFGQKSENNEVPRTTGTLLEPTWRPKGAQEAPQRPQATILKDFYRFFIDFEAIFYGFSFNFRLIPSGFWSFGRKDDGLNKSRASVGLLRNFPWNLYALKQFVHPFWHISCGSYVFGGHAMVLTKAVLP